MGQLFSRQVELWQPARRVELQLLVYLYIARIHAPLKQNCRRVYDLLASTSSSTSTPSCSKSKRANQIEAKGDGHPKAESHRWKWRQLAELPFLFGCFEQLSTCYMIYVTIKYIDPSLAEQLVGRALGGERPDESPPAHCYTLGRFVFHPFGSPADRIAALVFSLSHLTWRASQRYFRRPHFLTLVLFAQQPDADLAHLYARLAAHNNQVARGLTRPTASGQYCGHNCADRWVASHERVGSLARDSFGRPPPPKRLAPVSGTSSSSSNYHESRSEEEVASAGREWSPHELFLLRIMCYRVVLHAGDQPGAASTGAGGRARADNQGQCLFRLRPNRTLEASGELRREVTRSFITCCILFGCLFVVFLVSITYVVLSDWHYLQIYPGCDPGLAARQRAGQLSFWSMSLVSSWHRVATIVFDGLENLVIWFDSGLALVYQMSFCFILNKDLLLYWRHLDAKIELLLDRVLHRHYHHRHGICLAEAKPAPIGGRGGAGDHNQHIQPEWAPFEADLEAAIHELQSECCDFFQQIKSVDLFVSDLLGAYLIVWTLASASINQAQYNHLRTSQSSYLTIIMLAIEFGSFIGLALVSFDLFVLRQGCHKSFRRLCSLMAHDMSAHKGQFRSLIDYFTTKNKAFYTIFQTYPYSRSTLFSLFIWMISCFLVIDNINFKKQQQQQQQRAMIVK